jgi:hypothetical protein
MKRIFFLITLWITGNVAIAQIEAPVKWSYAAKKINAKEAVVFIKATIQDSWHIYSQHLGDGGPIKTSVTFLPSKEFILAGATIEPKPISKYETVFKMNVSYFEKSVIFQQHIKLIADKPIIIKGKLEYMTCNDKKCLPPEDVDFSITLN